MWVFVRFYLQLHSSLFTTRCMRLGTRYFMLSGQHTCFSITCSLFFGDLSACAIVWETSFNENFFFDRLCAKERKRERTRVFARVLVAPSYVDFFHSYQSDSVVFGLLSALFLGRQHVCGSWPVRSRRFIKNASTVFICLRAKNWEVRIFTLTKE